MPTRYAHDMISDRKSLRRIFYNAWQKNQANVTLTPLEQHIVALIHQHPEYHELMDNPAIGLDENYRSDNNPFLHLSLHISLNEQIQTDRPKGIKALYQQIIMISPDEHHAQHLIMEVMAELIWSAQQKNQLGNDEEYLEQIRSLLK